MRRILMLLVACAVCSSQSVDAKHTVTPLLPGLGIFEAFFAGDTLIDSKKLKVTEGKNSKLTIRPSYGLGYNFANYNTDSGGNASFSRDYDNLSCEGYDAIVMSFKPHSVAKINFELIADTDAGERKGSLTVSMTRYAQEIVLPLNGAKKIKSIELRMSMEKAGRSGNWGTIYYLALRNEKNYAAYRSYLKNLCNLPWDKLLRPESYDSQFAPRFGLFFKDKAELYQYTKYCKATGRFKFLVQKAQQIADLPVEELVDRELYVSALAARRRQDLKIHGSFSFIQSSKLGVAAALITRNAKALRNAAKMAIIMAVAESWYEGGMVANYPGMSIVHIPFGESYTAVSIAKILDFAGDIFTPTGMRYMCRILADKAVGPINYSAWTYRIFYISNQGAIFNKGRIAAYLILEKLGNKHVMPYTDLAMKELDESLNNCFAPDGGNIESPGYMMDTIACALPSYSMYAQIRGKKLAEILPKNLLNSGSYAETICSTSRKKDFSIIPYGCATRLFIHPQVGAFMAAALPDSQWRRIFEKYPGKKGLKDAGFWFEEKFYAWKYAQMIPDTPLPEHKAFVQTKSNGLVSSTRKLGNDLVKILFLGYNKEVGKRTSDKGSFMLEFAGDKIFIDPAYYAGFYASSDYHNMLSPCARDGRTPDQFVREIRFYDAGKTLVPVASGDASQLHVKMDVSAAWDKKYFKSHVRYLDSPTPDEITIKDVYELGNAANGVNFNLQTYQPLKIKGNTINIAGEYGSLVTVTVPNDCKITTEEYAVTPICMKRMGLEGKKLTRIIIHRSGTKGVLEIKIKLSKAVK